MINGQRAWASSPADVLSGVVVVGETVDRQEAARLVGGYHPEVVLMDGKMRGMDGLEAALRWVACRTSAGNRDQDGGTP